MMIGSVLISTAPLFDLTCSLSAAQVPDYSHLKPGSIVRLPIQHIIPTQGVVFIDRIQGYLDRGYEFCPEIVLKDGKPYVAIGHHRIMTHLLRGDTHVNVQVHDLSEDPPGMQLTVQERATTWRDIIWRLFQGGPVVQNPRPYLRLQRASGLK